MNRFQADPRLAGVIGEVLRCTCGVLGCTAVAGAISFGATPAAAGTLTEPKPRRSLPTICRHPGSITDWYTARMCKEAWLAMYEKSLKRSHERGTDASRWKASSERKPKTAHRPPPPKKLDKPQDKPSPRPAAPAAPARPNKAAPSSKVSPKSAATPQRPGAGEQAEGQASQERSLQPVLLLGLLLPVAAAICYPFRHRIYAAATTGTIAPSLVTEDDEPNPKTAHFTYRPAVDPFATAAMGLAGPGAVATARILALEALDEHGATSLVVIPRSDAAALFGLAEDEFLDETAPGLFIPGNLDAALAYLETELAIRQNVGTTDARRLLLVADCENESERITRLLNRHPGGVSAILLGAWAGGQVTIDDDGLVTTSSPLAAHLPERLPAMSRTEARDRLHLAIERQAPVKKRSSGRRSGPKRG